MFIYDEMRRFFRGADQLISGIRGRSEPGSLQHDQEVSVQADHERGKQNLHSGVSSAVLTGVPLVPVPLQRIILLAVLGVLLLFPLDATISRALISSQFVLLKPLRAVTDSLLSLPYVILFSTTFLIGLFYRQRYFARPAAERDLPMTSRYLQFFTGMEQQSLFALMALLANGLIVNILKAVIGRARPPLLEQVGAFSFHPFNYTYLYVSFPSGHAATAGVLAMLFTLWCPRFKLLFFIVFTVLAISRIAVAAHFPSDVLSGFTIGVMSCLLFARLLGKHGLLFTLHKGRIIPHLQHG